MKSNSYESQFHGYESYISWLLDTWITAASIMSCSDNSDNETRLYSGIENIRNQ